MLVPAARVARNDERHLWEAAEVEVVEIRTLTSAGPLIVRPSLPEHEHVVRVAVGDAVPSVVVDLPGHAGGLEQVKDHRVVEDAEPPDAVGGDPARGPGCEIEPIWPGGAKLRTEVVGAEGGGLEQAVVEGKVGRRVIAEAIDAVGGVETVHPACVPL